jgi:hypothetical protein
VGMTGGDFSRFGSSGRSKNNAQERRTGTGPRSGSLGQGSILISNYALDLAVLDAEKFILREATTARARGH